MSAPELHDLCADDAIAPGELARLPIFPLPNAVLLPGGLMPLHVFEPRYRDLVRDALAGSGLLAIARLRPGYQRDYDGRPPVLEHAGVGRIIASEEAADGRYMIVVRGLARVALARELPPVRAYREVEARLLPDAPAGADVLARAHGQLLALCERLSQALDRGGDQLRALLASCSCPGACADAIAAALVFDHDERQALLERLDPADRLERVADHVGKLLCELMPCSSHSN
ncbi:MAG: LON peptidase substrate-binding domain-containing protein [Myxococcales bacterium]|nr:LON peptidase substrate-binding domain-containing protein [Myxococcales bacterium]